MPVEKKFCLCGCGEEVKNKWVRGHHSRVNNISKRADIKEKRRKSMKRRHDEGLMPETWNKGKTQDTDERVKKNVRGLVKNAKSSEWRKKKSKEMRRNRLDGTIPTLRGSKHSQWQGGTSSITERIRGSHQLYKHWKRPIFEECKFRCHRCNAGSDKSLVVHHFDERMHEIIKRFLPEDCHELTWEEETEVVEDVVAYHLKNRVQGVLLCESCHSFVHDHEKHNSCHLAPHDISLI